MDIGNTIITALINGVVTSLIFLGFSEYIKSIFNGQLELQKGKIKEMLDEHEIMFSLNYPKMIEALRGIYKKAVPICQRVKDFPSGDKSLTDESMKIREEIDAEISSLELTLLEARISLPTKMVERIKEITLNITGLARGLLGLKAFLDDKEAIGPTLSLTKMTNFKSLKQSALDEGRDNDAWWYIRKASIELDNLLEELDNIYKELLVTPSVKELDK